MPRRWAALEKQLGESGRGHRDAFYLDTRIVHLRRLKSELTRQVFYERDTECFYIVNRDKRRTDIVTRARRINARLPFMKVVREYAMSHVVASGLFPTHASAFVVDGRAVLVAGHKRAGKTSLLLHALRGDGVRYLANDRVVLAQGHNGTTWARGFPTIVNLRASGLAHFPDVKSALLESGYFTGLTRREASRDPFGPARPWKPGQYTLSPAHLMRLLDVQPSAKARLGMILLPRVTSGQGRIRFRRLPTEEAVPRLLECVFRHGFVRKTGSLFAVDGKPRGLDDCDLHDRAHFLAGSVPVYECALGRRAYEDDRWRAALLKRLCGSDG